MDAEILSLERELEGFPVRLGRMGSSDPLSRRNGMESAYSNLYQKLVRLGARPQIKKKYRKAN